MRVLVILLDLFSITETQEPAVINDIVRDFQKRWIHPFWIDVNIASYWIYVRSSVEESIKAPDYTASWMTGINVKIWNLENTIKNLTDQVKVLQKQNDAMKTDVKVASKTGIGFYGP